MLRESLTAFKLGTYLRWPYYMNGRIIEMI